MISVGEIIRRRWQEVVLVVGLQVGIAVLANEILRAWRDVMQANEAVPSFGTGFVLGFGLIIISIVWQVLYLGFLATACHEGDKIQSPGYLVSVGKYFFWRFMRFEIAFGIVCGLLWMVILTIARQLFGFAGNVADTPLWLFNGTMLIAMVLLAKVKLLLPAEMIVRDRRVREAFACITHYEIMEAKWLVVMFGGFLGVNFLLSHFVDMMGDNEILHYIMIVFNTILSSVFMLALALFAIRFVVSQGHGDVVAEEVADSEIQEDN